MSGLTGVTAQPLNTPSPFIQAGPPQQIAIPDPSGRFNPLAAQGQALANQGQMNENQISQLQVQKAAAQKAIGNHISATLNPDGTPNLEAAMQASANDPHAAMGMQDFTNQVISNGQIQASTAQTVLQNAGKRYQNMLDITTPLLSKIKRDAQGNIIATPSLGDIGNSMATGVAAGLFPSDMALTQMSQLRSQFPQKFDNNGNPLPNPAYAQMVTAHANAAAGAQNAINDTLGSISSLDSGNKINLLQTSPENPPMNVGSLDKGVSPDTAATPVTGQGAHGEQTTTTLAGSGLLSQTPDGRLVANPSGSFQAHMAPRDAAFIAPNGYVDQLNDDAKSAQTTVSNLQQMQDLLPHIGAGSGSPFYNQLGNIAQAVGASKDVIDGLSRGDHDSWVKFQKTALLSAVTALKATVGGDRVASAQMQKFEDNLVSGKTSPGAAAGMLDYMHQLAQQPLLEQKKLAQFSNLVGTNDTKTGKPITFSQWPEIWSRIRSKTGATLQGYTPDGQTPAEAATADVTPGGPQ